MLAVAVVACAAAGIVIARAGIRPINRIIQTTRDIGSATLHERIATDGLPAELILLATTFNEMLDRLEARRSRRRRHGPRHSRSPAGLC